jgi:two-component system sensor histidine kinase CreC
MKIRTRIFLVFALIMAVGFFSLVRWMQGEMRPRYMEAQEDTLVDLSQMLASILSSEAVRVSSNGAQIDSGYLQDSFNELMHRRLDAQIYQLNKQHVDIRVYVTDARGKVIFDSDDGRDLNADYSRWRDVHRTLQGEYGARSTDLDPIYPDGSIMYIAAPVMHEGEIIGVVSVGKPTRNAERFMEHLLGNMVTVGLLILAIAIVIALIVHAWLSRPLARLQHYAEAVTRGERTTLPVLGSNEVGLVGQAMESMRLALDGKTYVTDYVQALTHELKGPIAAIQGASELLQEDMPERDRLRFLNNIHNETARMQELIERLLDLAALEYRPELELSETVDLRELADDVVDSLRPLLQSRCVRLETQGDNPVVVRGDYFLLARALGNLLKNAIEFSPAEAVVSLILKNESGRAGLTVCDEGPGIPAYARERVFDRFFSMARPDGRKGSGLGLSFVREIATLHGARIELDSLTADDLTAGERRHGTCITLNFPLNEIM